MTLVLELPEETERQLREAASSRGQEISQFVVEVATEKLLSLEEAGRELEVSAHYVEGLISLGLLDYRITGGEKRVSNLDLARYRRAVETNPSKAMDEMVGMNQYLGFYDE